MKKAILLLFLFIWIGTQAQEFNYRLNGVGSRSNMLAGAVTAGVRDNSAIYYNPSGLAFIENSSLSVSSNGYYLGLLNAKNAVGKGLNLKSNTLDGLPQIVSFIQKIPKLPISLTLALVNRHYSNIRTSYRNKMRYDVLPSNAGDELYVGSFSYYSKIREDWAGFGYGKKFSDRFGLGASIFVSYRSHSYFLSESADVYPLNNDTLQTNLLSNSRFSEELEYRGFGVILLMGASYEINNIKLGINITMPRVNLGFVSRSELKRDIFVNNPSVDPDITKISVWQIKVPSRYRSPLIIDLGANFKLDDVNTLHTKVSFFSGVEPYEILKSDVAGNNNLSVIIPSEIRNLDNMALANRPVFNAAAAIQRHVSEKFEAIVGFRTDFNYLDKKNLDKEKQFIPGLLTLNLYHFSGGMIWKTEKYNLSLGGSFSFGYKREATQYVNLSDPQIDNNLFGHPENSADIFYSQVGIFLGFTYFFPRIDLLNENKE